MTRHLVRPYRSSREVRRLVEFVHSHNVDKESTLAISSDEALDPSLLPSGCTPT